MFYWKRNSPGHYEARRDGEIVAVCDRVKDTGEPTWELYVFDGTPLNRKGFTSGTYGTLGEAQFAYGYAYRKLSEAA